MGPEILDLKKNTEKIRFQFLNLAEIFQHDVEKGGNNKEMSFNTYFFFDPFSIKFNYLSHCLFLSPVMNGERKQTNRVGLL